MVLLGKSVKEYLSRIMVGRNIMLTYKDGREKNRAKLKTILINTKAWICYVVEKYFGKHLKPFI